MMKEILVKYYNLDEETRKLLPLLYIYNELQEQLEYCDNFILGNLSDEEILMNLILFCYTNSIYDISKIVERMLEVLDGPNMCVTDLADLNKDELFELLDLEPFEEIKDVDIEGNEETEDKNIVVNVFLNKKEKD